MKLILDLGRRLLSRLVVLFVVLVTLIVVEANRQNQAAMDEQQQRIERDIDRLDGQIDKKLVSLKRSEHHQQSLKKKISKKTSELDAISNKLEASRRAKLKDKLPPWKVTEYLIDSVRLNVERASLAVEYSQLMFSIVDTNKQVAGLTIDKTALNNKLIIVRNSNLVDYILEQENATDLLTQSDWLLLLALFYGLFLGPVTMKAVNYYLFAPLAKKTLPIRINPEPVLAADAIRYDSPQKEFKVQVDDRHNLVVRPGWYSLNTEGQTRTRFFWDRKQPFASYAMGLVNMTAFDSEAGRIRQIRLAAEEDPNQDIMPVQLRDHPGYLVRQGHLVATSGTGLIMEKQWQLWDWRSWVYGNIRYVYFRGTGTLYVSGYGRISANDSSADTRIMARHVIGFETPTPFKLLRTETFASYWLNSRPLYDMHFPEQGRFLQQQAFGQRDDKILRSLLEDIFSAIGKILGLH